jgi:hypothetical protein
MHAADGAYSVDVGRADRNYVGGGMKILVRPDGTAVVQERSQ